MHTTLITGINGFVGQHLARAMKEADCQVWGLGQDPAIAPGISGYVDRYFECDLTDQATTAGLPWQDVNSVINLAGLANVGASWDNPELYQKVNVDVLANIGEVLLKQGLAKIRVIAVSTGGVYNPTRPQPSTEDSLLVNPDTDKTSPYVASKLQMEKVAHKLAERGLNCVVVRPFNHIGPGQRPGFLVPDLAEQINQAATEGLDTIMVGNLQTKRDYTDVRDVVRAYRSLALSETLVAKPTNYNVCSGRPLSGVQILDLLAKSFGVPDVQTEPDPKRKARASDPEILSGDHTALTNATGWQPEIPAETTIKDFVAWYKTQV